MQWKSAKITWYKIQNLERCLNFALSKTSTDASVSGLQSSWLFNKHNLGIQIQKGWLISWHMHHHQHSNCFCKQNLLKHINTSISLCLYMIFWYTYWKCYVECVKDVCCWGNMYYFELYCALLAADSSSISPNVVCLLFVVVYQVEKLLANCTYLLPNCYLTAT